jgi:hypothetical protein
MNDICITNCNHQYCKSCLNKWFDKKKTTCPICIQEIKSYTNNLENFRIIFKNINNINNQQDNINLINPEQILINKFIYRILKITLFGLLMFSSISIPILIVYNIKINSLENKLYLYTNDYNFENIKICNENGIKYCNIPKIILNNCS